MMNIAYASCDRRDKEAILDLWETLMHDHHQLDPRIRIAPNARDFAADMFFPRSAIVQNLIGAKKNGVIIGFAFGLVVENLRIYAPDEVGLITDCVVSPTYRNQGIGEQLVQRLLNWFRDQDISEVEVSVATKNQDALRFWRRSGALDKMVRLCYQL